MSGQSAWQTRSQLAAVTIIFWVYLVIGALIFSAVERGHIDDLKEEYLNAAEGFLSNNSCVDIHDLREYSRHLVAAYDGGLRWSMEQGFNASAKDGYHNWDFINSLFFSATVVTTIGYGHLSPNTHLGQSICIVYALFGIPLSGLLVTTIGVQLQKRLKDVWKRLVGKLNCFNLTTKSKGRRMASVTALIVVAVCFYAILIVLPACVFYYVEGWDWLTSQYYAFISFTTIGFGDYVAGDSPTLTVTGRIIYKIVLIFYLVVGMGFVTLLLQGIQRQNEERVKQLSKRQVIRTIMKKRRLRKQAGRHKDSPDGLNNDSKNSRSVIGDDEYVIVTTTTKIISEDDSQNDEFELEDIESKLDYETISVVDRVIQTTSTTCCDSATQTDCDTNQKDSECKRTGFTSGSLPERAMHHQSEIMGANSVGSLPEKEDGSPKHGKEPKTWNITPNKLPTEETTLPKLGPRG